MHQEIIDKLYALNPDTVKLGLENISRLLNKLGDPHRKLSTIHIAGTNGKGSTAFFLNSIFNTAGYKTGLYLSPHIIDIRERFVIGPSCIPEKKFCELTEYIFYILEKDTLSVTFFEFVTALAFLYFNQEKIDIGIIEVGLGGRFDATNVLTPLVSIITEIGLEHTNYLGPTIEEIAFEKGGIIKSGGTVFVSTEEKDAIGVIQNVAEEKGATSFYYGKDFSVKKNLNAPSLQRGEEGATGGTNNLSFARGGGICQTFSLKFQGLGLKKLAIETAGTFQIKNSSTAATVALYLKEKFPKINEDSIRNGLRYTKIPCRMELVQNSPRIVLDAAHNQGAIQALFKDITLFFNYKRLIVLLGVLKDKDYKQIAQLISSKADILIITEPKTERALPAHLLEKETADYCVKTYVEKEISKALCKAKEMADLEDLILVTGSFYTVGEVFSGLS